MNTATLSNPQPLSPQVVHAQDGECQNLPGESRRLILTEQQTGGVLALSHRVVAFEGGPAEHASEHHDEMFLVQSGEFDFCLDGRAERLSRGDFLFAPSQISHGYSCQSREGGALLAWSLAAGESVAQPKVMRSGEGEWIEAFGDRSRALVSSGDSGGRFCLCDSLTPPLSGPPPHLHDREDETFVVLSGRFEFLLGDARVQAGEGDVVFAPRGVPHTFRVVSAEEGRYMVLATPGGFDLFFRDAQALFESGQATPASIVEMSMGYGISFLPPGA